MHLHPRVQMYPLSAGGVLPYGTVSLQCLQAFTPALLHPLVIDEVLLHREDSMGSGHDVFTEGSSVRAFCSQQAP